MPRIPGIDALNRSSFASASSRSESRTLHRGQACNERRELALERPVAAGVVEEVLLGLVEQEVDVAPRLARALDRRLERVRSARRRPRRTPPPRSPRPGSPTSSRRRRRPGAPAARAAAAPPRPRGATTCRRRSGRRAPSAVEATTFAQTISTSRSRPKKSIASIAVSANGVSPLYGDAGSWRSRGDHSRRAGRRGGRRTRSRPPRRRGRRGRRQNASSSAVGAARTAHDAYGAARPPRSRLTTSRRFQSARS